MGKVIKKKARGIVIIKFIIIIMKGDCNNESLSLSSTRYQHFQVMALLLTACFVYSLAVQYTLICCKEEKGTWQFQNFSNYRNKQSMILGRVIGGALFDKMYNNTTVVGGL